jgi:hypothetical protein
MRGSRPRHVVCCLFACLLALTGASDAKTGHHHSNSHSKNGAAALSSARAAGAKTSHWHGKQVAQSTLSTRRKNSRSASGRTAHGRGRKDLTARGRQNVHLRRGASTANHVAKSSEPTAEPSDYQSQAKIYSLYDQGLNARLLGDPHTAVSRLAEATEMARESKLSPTLSAEAQYELGRAAEAAGESSVAVGAFTHCLRMNPRFTDASLRLASLLLRSGKPMMALMTAREAAQRSPNDARAHMVLALVLDHSGFASDARGERERATRLMHGEGRVNEPAQRIESVPGTQPSEAESPEPGEEEGRNQGSFEPQGRAGPPTMLIPPNGKINSEKAPPSSCTPSPENEGAQENKQQPPVSPPKTDAGARQNKHDPKISEPQEVP